MPSARSLPTLLVVALVACGGEPAAPTAPVPSPTSAPTASTAPPAASTTPSLAAGAPATTVEAEPVDLLHATRAAIATSSAYHDDATQVARLVDGDLGTSWNSRTGDLVGAWIEFAVPADARVTSVALTAGYTHQTDRSDLFAGNHRVTRVRVLREGTEVGGYDLDPESRALQTIPVEGAGGRWRIEVAAVVPGSHDDWRETCISELRVMGRAPGAEAGRTPVTAVGSLPDLAEADPVPGAATAGALPPPDVLAPARAVEAAPAMAALVRTITDEQITRLRRTDDAAPWLGRVVSVTAATDRTGTWGCFEDGGTTRCVTLDAVDDDHPWRATFGETHDAYEARFFRYDAAFAWWYVHLAAGGTVSAERRDPGTPYDGPSTSLPAPAMRPAPAWLGVLRGLDVTSARDYVAVTSSGWLSVCRRAPELVCTPGVPAAPVQHRVTELDGVDAIGDEDEDGGSALSVGFGWTDRRGGLEDQITGSMLVAVSWSPATLRLRATMLEDAQRAPIDPDDDALDYASVSYDDAELVSDTCWQMGAATTDPEDARLVRAPDRIPVTGIADPFTQDVRGSWAVLSGGGLRRQTEPCEEVEEEEYDDGD